jgi:ankyrin repeat protein
LNSLSLSLSPSLPLSLSPSLPPFVLSFVQASEDGHVALVKQLISRVDIECCRNEYESTALIKACMMGHLSIVKFLLSCGANVNAANRLGNTALMLAAQEGTPSLVELLLDYNAHIDLQGQDGNTALIIAARDGNTAAAKVLVTAGANLVLKNTAGNTALMVAAREGCTSVTALLVEALSAIEAERRASSMRRTRSNESTASSMHETLAATADRIGLEEHKQEQFIRSHVGAGWVESSYHDSSDDEDAQRTASNSSTSDRLVPPIMLVNSVSMPDRLSNDLHETRPSDAVDHGSLPGQAPVVLVPSESVASSTDTEIADNPKSSDAPTHTTVTTATAVTLPNSTSLSEVKWDSLVSSVSRAQGPTDSDASIVAADLEELSAVDTDEASTSGVPAASKPSTSLSGTIRRSATLDETSHSKTARPKDLVIQWARIMRETKGRASQLRKHAQLRAIICHGIPSQMRPAVWMSLSGATSEKSKHPPDYYQSLVADTETQLPHLYRRQIEKDLPRTLPDVKYFRTTEGRSKLRRVLTAYCCRNPESVGYCQSMNVITGVLIMTLKNEEDVFWVLASMIENRMGYYARSMCGLKVDQRVLGDMIAYWEPDLFDHMTKHDVHIHAFTISWFLCLFMENPLPHEQGAVFWDNLLLYGDELLFQLAIGILAAKREEILSITDTEHMLDYMLHNLLYDGLDVRDLLARTHIGSQLQHISKLRAFHRDQVLDENAMLDEGTSRRLMREFDFENSVEVQGLWAYFLSPAPWPVLLTSTIPSVVWLYRAFAPVVFSEAERARWRDHGLFSGVFDRLFAVLDVDHSGKVSFEEYLRGVYLFRKSTLYERQQFAFEFCAMQMVSNNHGNNQSSDSSSQSNVVLSRGALTKVMTMLHNMYNGKQGVGVAEEQASQFCSMMFEKSLEYKASSTSIRRGGFSLQPSRGFTLAEFRIVAPLHPFLNAFFRLEAEETDFDVEQG